MTPEIFYYEQGTPDWFLVRMGIPTASEFQTVMQKGRKRAEKDGGGFHESEGRRTYMLKLAGERLTGHPMYSFSNEHMERGRELEAEARDLYALVTDTEPEQIGFMRWAGAGASPDSLVGDVGLLEIKTKLPHLHLPLLLADAVPDEHIAQVQGQLSISDREWLDFVSYWPGLPLFIKRVFRDEPYIVELEAGIARFNDELEAMVEQVRRYGAAKAPPC